MGEACSKHGKMRNVYTIFVRQPEGKRPLGRPRNERMIIGLEWESLD
jgi:hypothetical protein